MNRIGIVLALATVAACARDGDSKQVEELSAKVAQLDGRLGKIEKILEGALNQPPEPDPAAVYSMPVDGDPSVGPPDAKVTIVEAFEFA